MSKRLVVSAAHTLQNPGAVYSDLREADLTRKIVGLMTKHLEKEGVEHKIVPLDLILMRRIDWINETGFSEDTDDIFIEIHINDGGKRGIEGWYSDAAADGNRSQIFAEFILEELAKETKYTNIGAKSEFKHPLTNLLILNQTNTISIALELLFIDNEEDIKILKDEAKLDDLALKLVLAVKKYINSDKSNKPANATKKEVKPLVPKANNAPFGNFGSSNDNMFGMPKANGSSGSGSNLLLDRDSRKKMITDTYKRVMGKEAKEADVSYYVNNGTTEEQLLVRLTKSKEFEKMVEDAQKASEIESTKNVTEAEMHKLKTQVADLMNINNNLNMLLQVKNNQIAQMQQVLTQNGVIKNGEYFDYNNPGRYMPRK